MAKIYRKSDRIKLKIGEVTVDVAPLSFHEKTEIQMAIHESAKSGDTMGIIKAAFLCVKYAVKGISGVENADGSSYEVQMENDILTDECVNDLFSLEESDKLSMVCLNLLQGKYDEFKDPNTGERIKGVSLLKKEKPVKKQKRIAGS